ncbi:MAG: hypothetical protein M1324_00795 [Patescibacteria group bacterium]|nr:hypothetical protein [Patescibacteria group bacterium]
MVKQLKKFTVFLCVSLVLLANPSHSLAEDKTVSEFLDGKNYNNLLADRDFVDIKSLDVDGIQKILTDNGSFLKDYKDSSSSGGGRSAAQIIYDAANGLYSDAVGTAKGITIDSNTGTISPKVIIVMLQKEQSLITMATQDDGALDKAMGYMCPDGGVCDSAYAGFAKQVGWGAWQLRYNYEAAQKDIGWWNTNYGAGNSSICYTNQNKSVSDYTGSYDVTFSNATTASVYRYTPHVFDSAYNFWKIFLRWFSPSPAPSPAPASDPTSNDTAQFDTKTYAENIVIKGTKLKTVRAYFGDKLLADMGDPNWTLSYDLPLGEKDDAIVFRDSTGAEINRKPIRTKRHKQADIDGNGTIDITDLAVFAENWNKENPPEPMADIDGNRMVDITDLAVFAENWGK